MPRSGEWSAGTIVTSLGDEPLLSSVAPGAWEVRLNGGSVASFDIRETTEVGAAIDVSTSHELSETEIRQLYDVCALIAERLGGSVYDPQGDSSQSPGQLRAATDGVWSREVLLTVAEVAFGGLGFLVAGSWWVAGQPRNDLWVGSAFALLAAWFSLRVVRKRSEKRR